MTDAAANPHIVVGVDGSPPSERALAWAARQAQITEASLEVLTTWRWPTYGWGMSAPIDYNPMDDAERVLSEALGPLRDAHPTLKPTATTVEGYAAPALVEASRGADLLVVGSRGRGEFAGMLIGSVGQHCAAHAHSSVLVFREPSVEATTTPRIVVGVDGGESSLHALDWAIRQAELSNAALEVVSTWEWPTSYGRGMPLPLAYEPANETAAALENVLAAIRPLHPALDIHTAVVKGHPAAVLVEASRNADLLVVGSRGHGEFVGMLLGSVSEHCVASADCPVLVYRERR